MTTVTEAYSPLRHRRPVLVAVLLLLLHGAIAVVLVALGLTIALSVGGPTVGRDELYRMGPALQLATAGAVLPLLLAGPAALIVGYIAPRRSWVAPVVGICTSVVLWGASMLFLHAPEPVLGG